MNSQRDIFYVPWADFSEWNTVREQMFSGDINDTIKAYKTILMWKLKYNSIPAYIECTYSLLQVMVKEYEMSKKETPVLLSENELQLSYSMALIRFVNHLLSVSSYKGLSLYLAAKTQNIPDWIINMRHDVAHGQDLPTLDALHQAAELSLQWLLDYYWANMENSEEKSLRFNQFDLDLGNFEAVDIDIQNFFKKVFDLWELCQSRNYNKLQYVMEADREFMLQVHDVLSSYKNYFNATENEVYAVIEKTISKLSQMKKNDADKSIFKFKHFEMSLLKFVKGIIKANPQLKHLMVLSLLETTILLENDFDPTKWQNVLHLLQQTSSFQFFLEILFEYAGKGHKGATTWLSVLAPSIKYLKKQWAMFKMFKKEKKTMTKLLKKKIRKVLKPESNVAVTLYISKPPVLTLEIIKNCLLNPENFSLEDIIQYLNLVKPPIMKETLNMIIDVVSLQKGESNKVEITEFDKIYTVEDLNEVLISENNLVFEESTASTGWTKTSIDFDAWNKCPMGLLPFQSKVDCTLPNNLKWKKIKLSQRTASVPLLRHGIAMKKMLQI